MGMERILSDGEGEEYGFTSSVHPHSSTATYTLSEQHRALHTTQTHSHESQSSDWRTKSRATVTSQAFCKQRNDRCSQLL